ncbi:MAG: cobyrinate a,c-diamide synthase [Deltaproteobacteria bacterium]|nr:cobyrinate a,c-diamide synthase [Deltaproteobacteria bacterium]MBW2658002.1 cobyrinate a,c-diamide synthase [Deltaproteobacteria bacterium]
MAGTSSGSGKTTVSLGLMAAFKDRGLRVQPFKCGPDFIDPGLHKLVTGTISRNLDLWMSGTEFTHHCFHQNLQNCDIAIIEGVMGMFDGGGSSSAALALSLGVSTILVLDVRSTAESAAAMVKGFETLDPRVAPKGIILNRIASERHLELVSEAIKSHCSAEILGHIPRTLEFSIPSRHLGLLTGEESPLSDEAVQTLMKTVTTHIDLDRILELFSLELPVQTCADTIMAEKSVCRIGIARDKAFCFYYQDNLDLLEKYGAELISFSPLHDSFLPENLDALYLGGGYPELYAGQLGQNQSMLDDIQKFVEKDGTVYAECGGFMYLTEGITGTDGTFHPMAGIFPVKAHMQKKRAGLGYREVTTVKQSFFGPPGTTLRGHEFHYSYIDEMPAHIDRIYKVNNESREGYCYKNVLGGYMHHHFGYNPQVVEEFIHHSQMD